MIIAGYDLESTGLNEPEHRIIEACVMTYEYDPATKAHRLLDTWEQRIDPERSIDAKAQAVHGITPADLIGKPKWAEVAPTLSAKLNGADVVVAHNGLDFDFTFTIRELERVGVPLPDFEPFDSMVQGRWATPFGKAPSLMELCWATGVPYDPALAHAASYDVSVMMEAFFNGLRRETLSL